MPGPLKVRKYLLKQRSLGPDPRLADSPTKAEKGPRICISNKFPGCLCCQAGPYYTIQC